jgi:hypothetical protein
MNDKIIGLVMIISSLSIIGFLLYWTIIMPIIWKDRRFDAYIGLAITVFVIVATALLFIAWVGRIFLKNRAPKEGVFDEQIEEYKKTND